MKNISEEKTFQKELLKIVEASGTSGISLKSLVKYFKVDSDELNETLTMLSKRKLVKVVKVKQGSKEEFIIYPARIKIPTIPISLNTVSEVPCFICKYLKECEVDKNPSPQTCEILKIWLERKRGSDLS
ncbi:MAG: hypothetical protein QW039_01400 [Fervidicoccaceae archaeon]